MSDKVYNVPAEWASRAWVDNAKYQAMYKRSVEDPNGFWGEHGQAHRLDQALHQGQEHLLSTRTTSRSNGTRTARSTSRANCIDRHLEDARRPGRHHLGGRRPDPRREDHLPPAARARLQVRQRAEGQRRQEGRPRHHLPADDPRGGLRHARLRAHRRRPLGGVRRLLARQPRRPHRRCRLQVHHHRRRGRARRHGRSRSRRTPTRRSRSARATRRCWSCAAPAAPLPWTAGRDIWLHEELVKVDGRLPAGRDERRGPAVHPLHLRLDRQAQGRAAHHAAAISSTPR